MFRIVKFLKDFLLFFPISRLVAPFSKLFEFLFYFNKLITWIHKHKKTLLYSDYYSPVRDYAKRFQLYKVVAARYGLGGQKIVYLEFGVASGESFKWWTAHNTNKESFFCGFDTFTGLPEDWGMFFVKGDMSSEIPTVDDTRAKFVKGLFQDTLNNFITKHTSELQNLTATKVIHMDADLYSATIFTLSQLYPFLKKGDIILFDEFNVALHEFKAFIQFTESFYVHLKPIAAVNNFYQIAFEVG